MRISPRISIDESELQEDFVRASGPGGQNVNKVETAVQLRFDAARSEALPQDVKRRLLKLAGRRATEEGEVVIDARRHRTRERNRAEARRRLADLIRRAATPPKRRRKTRPSLASKRRRLENKRRKSRRKELRKRPRRDEE
jgi:ribosome-associated protein